jgi:hypothetical protein
MKINIYAWNQMLEYINVFQGQLSPTQLKQEQMPQKQKSLNECTKKNKGKKKGSPCKKTLDNSAVFKREEKKG